MIDQGKFIFEKTSTGYSAYSPEYPGVGVAADTAEEAARLLVDAIGFHLDDDFANLVVLEVSGVSQVVFPQSHSVCVSISSAPTALFAAAPTFVLHA